MTSLVTSTNQQLLKNLPQYPLHIDDQFNAISKNDLYFFLQNFPNLFQFIGQGATTSIKFNTSSTQLLCSWPGRSASVATRFSNRIFVGIGPPQNDSLSLPPGGWKYIFDLASFTGGTAATNAQKMSITMANGLTNPSIGITALPNFLLSSYSDGHVEFGFTYASVAAVNINSSVTSYLAAPTSYDDVIPTLNSTSSQAMTAGASVTLTLSTNDGTNWYGWAITTSNSGGTTNGFV